MTAGVGPALVTGGAGYVGAGICLGLAKDGRSVGVADIDGGRAEEVARDLRARGFSAVGIALDVTDEVSTLNAVERVRSEWGALDTLVNAAGIYRPGRIEDVKISDWRDVIETNIIGSFLCSRAAVPLLRANGGGSIINVSSVSAFAASDGGSAYTTSKGALLSFTYALSGELAPDNIRVVAVCPGWVDGGFTQQVLDAAEDPEVIREQAKASHLLGRMATPLDLANSISFLASDKASFITGTALYVDGGFMVRR
jgi:NAD(P)-dependent dehydrogenase (short-subunit alcohol dehydrogenase family)